MERAGDWTQDLLHTNRYVYLVAPFGWWRPNPIFDFPTTKNNQYQPRSHDEVMIPQTVKFYCIMSIKYSKWLQNSNHTDFSYHFCNSKWCEKNSEAQCNKETNQQGPIKLRQTVTAGPLSGSTSTHSIGTNCSERKAKQVAGCRRKKKSHTPRKLPFGFSAQLVVCRFFFLLAGLLAREFTPFVYNHDHTATKYHAGQTRAPRLYCCSLGRTKFPY